jgi:hypothetical protein
MVEPSTFAGHVYTDKHRTTGGRAWCHGCGEWCYPHEPCGQLRCCAERIGEQVRSNDSRIAAIVTSEPPEDLLRAAAVLIREVAAAATPGTWSADPTGTVCADADLVRDVDGSMILPSDGPQEVAECYRVTHRDERKNNARHIATWHPGVADLVAGLLEAVARTQLGDYIVKVPLTPGAPSVLDAALAVARALHPTEVEK